MPAYLKGGPIGYCQRCGEKWLHAELVEDGSKPLLYVCPPCWDDDHPQDYPITTGGLEGHLDNPLPPISNEPVEIHIGQFGDPDNYWKPYSFAQSEVKIGTITVETS